MRLATVTPLASIFGSGFLIIIPILERELGALAAAGMAAVCLLAWMVGIAIRHNVAVVEPLADAGSALLIFRQLAGLSTAIADMHQAAGELDRARELQEVSQHQLASVTAELQAREVRAHTGTTSPERPGCSGQDRDERAGPAR